MELALPRSAPRSVAPSLSQRARERLVVLGFLIVSALFLFVDGRLAPLALQDEARNANNALEMFVTGPSLVTTFGFEPDLWNTKPPLLIWLMDLSMTLFGPSEWAMRIPSALAALGTLLTTILFIRRVSGSLLLALTAAAVLLLSPGFFGEHGARTADYDALLTFFVTAALQLLFLALHRREPRWGSLLLVGALVGAGALTKSIAAFVPVAGVGLYLVISGRFGRMLRHWPRFALAAAVAILPLLLFYALRERTAPGYLDAVFYNDLAGRLTANLNSPTNPLFYLTNLPVGWFVAGPFLLAAPLAVARLPRRQRLLMLFAASIAGVTLLVLSAANNRALQYALPAFPWLAVLAAAALRYVTALVTTAWHGGRTFDAGLFGLAFGLVAMLMVGRALDWRYHRFPERDHYPQSSYGELFGALAARGVSDVTIVDPGSVHLGRSGYAPLLQWHRLRWRERGLVSHRLLSDPAATMAPLATCHPAVAQHWPAKKAERIGSCAVLWGSAASHGLPR